jgi:hypothetical protein
MIKLSLRPFTDSDIANFTLSQTAFCGRMGILTTKHFSFI